MRGDGGVSGCSGEVLTVFVGDVLPVRVFEALGQAEINNIYVVLC